MQEITDDILKAHILYKLSRHKRWGAKHTALLNVRTALPREHQARCEELARKLSDEGMITWLKKTGEIHISLNPHKKKEIVENVEKYLGQRIW